MDVGIVPNAVGVVTTVGLKRGAVGLGAPNGVDAGNVTGAVASAGDGPCAVVVIGAGVEAAIAADVRANGAGRGTYIGRGC